MSSLKDKAARVRRLEKDETFQEVFSEVQQRQIAVFIDSSATMQDIEHAKSILTALDEIQKVIRSALDDEAVFDKQNS
jgi:hypothetical protein